MTYFVMIDYDTTVFSSESLAECEDRAREVFASEPFMCNVCVMDEDENIVCDLGMTQPGHANPAVAAMLLNR